MEAAARPPEIHPEPHTGDGAEPKYWRARVRGRGCGGEGGMGEGGEKGGRKGSREEV